MKHKISFSGWASPNPVGLNYKGAKKSHLSSGQVTEVIVSLLVAAGIDPVRVQHDAEGSDLPARVVVEVTEQQPEQNEDGDNVPQVETAPVTQEPTVGEQEELDRYENPGPDDIEL